MAVVMTTQPQSLHLGAAPVSSLPFLPSKLFKVKNVDDKGRIIHLGYLEITDTDVVFTYEHYPSDVSKWPLTAIRKYGVNLDGDIFALEAGRRAPTGEGLYAFRTENALEIRQRLDYYTGASSDSAWQFS